MWVVCAFVAQKTMLLFDKVSQHRSPDMLLQAQHFWYVQNHNAVFMCWHLHLDTPVFFYYLVVVQVLQLLGVL